VVGRRSRLRLPLSTGLVVSLAFVLAARVEARPAAAGSNPPVFGVLRAQPKYLQADAAAGIRLAVINVDWKSWEPAPRRFSKAYASKVDAAVRTYRAHGWEVAIDVGLQTPPAWVLHWRDGQLTDQNGNLSGTPNYEFNPTVRTAAGAYIADLVRALGPSKVEYYRVGLSISGEMLYGPNLPRSWWAYGIAQRSSPLPGWVPGNPTYRGQPITGTQVHQWYDWYLRSLVNAEEWEITAYRSAGFGGSLELVMPGWGAVPSRYNELLSNDLAPNPDLDPDGTMNTGAVWWRQLAMLSSDQALGALVVDISSVGDSSGTNGCQSDDRQLNLDQADPAVSAWSDTRWLTYLAGAHHLPVMGENAGDSSAAELPTIASLVQSCHLEALQWAWDNQLHDGTHASLEALRRVIQELRPG
jgi:hypothetical protein